MPKYRKKPVVIEAFKLGHDLWPQWMRDAEQQGLIDATTTHYYIKTLEGRMLARLGDYIIKGVKNEIYPCKPDIFEATHEPVESPAVEDMAKEFAEDVKRHRVRMP
jgi:hypothetical protein